MKINSLPARTWEWLKVNETIKEGMPVIVGTGMDETLSGSVMASDTEDMHAGAYADIRTGFGDEFGEAVMRSGIKCREYQVAAADTESKIVQRFDLSTPEDVGTEPAAGSVLCFDVEDGAQCIVYQFITSDTQEAPRFVLQNRYRVADGGRLTLVQIQNLGAHAEFYDDCGGVCGDGAVFKRIQIVLGGGRTYTGEFCDLAGERSRYVCDIGYDLSGGHELDMNYVADHHGKNSESDIHVSGVMAEEARKVFRGTIDFHRGCSGAKGAEIEDVLLLDDTIENKTVPLILCDEEDVEGSHGASIGQLDENLMFYMKSRGIDENDIYDMMARARIDAVSSLIPDLAVRDTVSEMMGRKIERDCLDQRKAEA